MEAPSTCIFCGVAARLTREHVFGDWLRRTGLPQEAISHAAGRLNRNPRELGVSRPFASSVRDVCGRCNNGWMSQLETVAAKVLTPLVLGSAVSISNTDRSAIAAWVHKTALVNMLVSSEDERSRGYGLLPSEYRELFALREQQIPLPRSQFWLGRYQGRQLVSVCVTPMIVKVDGSPEPNTPQAYLMTVVLGKLMIQGIRFTTPGLQFDLLPGDGFVQFWPGCDVDVAIPAAVIDDRSILQIEKGRRLRAALPGISLAPWRPATELPWSTLDGEMMRLPAPCGKHSLWYPSILADAGLRGIRHAFVRSCECGKSYLIETEHDGAHFKGMGPGAERMYEALHGEELRFLDESGIFLYKRLPATTE